MLSSVSKLADKAFVMGFFLPALLGVYVALKILHCPPWLTALCTVKAENPFESLTYVALAVWVVAVLLLSLNHLAYRVIEGYTPPLAWLPFLKSWHRWQYSRLVNKRKKLAERDKKSESGKLWFDTLNKYPSDREDFLPTLFGNAIRAFEVYPWDVYQVDGVVVWERLGAVIPSSVQQAIADARSQVDFFVNVILLSFAISVGAALKLLLERTWHIPTLACNLQLLEATIVGGIVVAALAYYMSLKPIVTWGDTVKSAFDCYLPALAAQLGYELPATGPKRRDFWHDMNTMFIYRRPPPKGKWKFAAAKGADDAAAHGGKGGGKAGDGEGDDDGGEADGD
jgi:hypothetical protein